jgi:hypothetical protein
MAVSFTFSSDRKRMSVVVNVAGQLRVYTKGASEMVLALCTDVVADSGATQPIADDHRARLEVRAAVLAEPRQPLAGGQAGNGRQERRGRAQLQGGAWARRNARTQQRAQHATSEYCLMLRHRMRSAAWRRTGSARSRLRTVTSPPISTASRSAPPGAAVPNTHACACR